MIVAPSDIHGVREAAEQLVRKWAPILGLDGWAIFIHVGWYGKDDAVGGVVLQGEYDKMTIYLNLDHLHATHENPDFEELVLHELCHALTAEMWTVHNMLVSMSGGSAESREAIHRLCRESIEKTTTRATRALMAAHGRPANTFDVHQSYEFLEEDNIGRK